MRRKIMTLVWLFGPWVVMLPVLVALRLWERMKGRRDEEDLDPVRAPDPGAGSVPPG